MSGSISAAADLSSPKSAFRAYTDAITTRNFDALKGMIDADDSHLKMIKGQLDYDAIEKRFRAASDKAFPGATSEPSDNAPTLASTIDKADVQTNGDTATLTTTQTMRPILMKKESGEWKVDLNAMYPGEVVSEVVAFRKALADVMDSMTHDIEAGKYKTYNEVKNDLEIHVKMKLATPSESNSTQPSL